MKQLEKVEWLYVAASLCISAGALVEAGPGIALITLGVAMLLGAMCKWLFTYMDGE
jgi:hypothetical protein